MIESPTIETFETVKRGHRVIFSPKNAIGGAQGLRKSITGKVVNLDTATGLAQIEGGWVVPVKRLQRTGSGAYREYSRAARKAERQRIYGALPTADKKKLLTCAQDARAAFLSTTPYSGPANKAFYSEMKGARERFMREHGIEGTDDKAQCSALPLMISRALARDKVPELRGVDFKSADRGEIGIGDVVKIGGHPYKFVSYSPEGNAILKDGHTIEVPAEYVPRDKTGPVDSVFKRKMRSRAERRASLRKSLGVPERRRRPRMRRKYAAAHTPHVRRGRRRDCFTVCVRRDPRGRFSKLRSRGQNPQSRVVVETDLFGRRLARLVGDSGKAIQIPLFDREHELTPEEKAERRETVKWRKQRDEGRRAGQQELFENPPAGTPWLWLLGTGALIYLLARSQTKLAQG